MLTCILTCMHMTHILRIYSCDVHNIHLLIHTYYLHCILLNFGFNSIGRKISIKLFDASTIFAMKIVSSCKTTILFAKNKFLTDTFE